MHTLHSRHSKSFYPGHSARLGRVSSLSVILSSVLPKFPFPIFFSKLLLIQNLRYFPWRQTNSSSSPVTTEHTASKYIISNFSQSQRLKIFFFLSFFWFPNVSFKMQVRGLSVAFKHCCITPVQVTQLHHSPSVEIQVIFLEILIVTDQ